MMGAWSSRVTGRPAKVAMERSQIARFTRLFCTIWARKAGELVMIQAPQRKGVASAIWKKGHADSHQRAWERLPLGDHLRGGAPRPGTGEGVALVRWAESNQ